MIDGCPTGCGRKTFERLGLPCKPLVLTDYGVEKGKTLIDEAVIAATAQRIAEDLFQS